MKYYSAQSGFYFILFQFDLFHFCCSVRTFYRTTDQNSKSPQSPWDVRLAQTGP